MLPLLARCQVLDLDSERAMNSYFEMMNDARSRRALKVSMLCPLTPDLVAKCLELASKKKVPNPEHHWLHKLIASVDSSKDALPNSLAAYHFKDWRGMRDTIEAVLKHMNLEIDNVNDGSAAKTGTSMQDDRNSEIRQK
ncbi:unnamed protein product [Alternaria alternata]